jgi:hypothetical protein
MMFENMMFDIIMLNNTPSLTAPSLTAWSSTHNFQQHNVRQHIWGSTSPCSTYFPIFLCYSLKLSKCTILVWLQGDQNGRIFAHWAIPYLGIFSKSYFCITYWATCSSKSAENLVVLTKYGLGDILGDI